VSIVRGGVNVSVLSEHASQISFCLFDAAGEREIGRIPLAFRTGDRHHGFIRNVKPGTRYGLRADGPWAPSEGHRFDPAKLLVDPYAVELDRPFAHRPELAAPRDAAIDTAPFVPKAVVRAALPAVAIEPRPPRLLYELSARTFTRSFAAIPKSRRGTLSGLAHPRALAHLRRLGVDAVEIMPIAAWCDERHLPALGLANVWGYNPVTFMAPDPRLAPGGMAEVRSAVAALRKAGLSVILDVVFNHTAESDADGATLSFRGLDSRLYYRHDEHGRLLNLTGCGNTVASDRDQVRDHILDALRHWAAAGFDGFRFDLATVLGRTSHGFATDAALLQAIEQDPVLGRLTMIAEPWDAGPDGYRLGGFPARWREWNDRYRDDVRRFWRGAEGGMGHLATRLAGSSDLFATSGRRPSASINYVAAHDGFTLRDLVSYATKHNLANGEDNRDGSSEPTSWNDGVEGETDDPDIAARRAGDVHALLATLFLSRGTPMLAAGDELGRTQGGNNNAYAQDNATTWLDWNAADLRRIAYVAGLIDFRFRHPAVSADRFLTGLAAGPLGLPDVRWIAPDGADMTEPDWHAPGAPVLGVVLHDDVEDRVCLWFNRGPAPVDAALPAARPGHVWVLEVDSSRAAADLDEEIETASVELPPRSVMALGERRLPVRRPSRQADDRVVEKIAAAAGIQPDWWTIGGEHHRVGIETKRALLKAMGHGATGAAAAETLRMLTVARLARPLPEVHVVEADRPFTLPLSIAARDRDRPVTLHVTRDSGEAQATTLAPGDLAATGRIDVEGDQYATLAAGLPPLPMGYHDVRIGDDEPSCRLIVAPPAAYMPEELGDGGRRWGLAAHLYALRHDGDAGIGDAETLARYGATTAALGGTLAGINPLHHLFPTDRGRASPYQPSDRRFVDPIYVDLAALVQETGDGEARRRLAGSERRLAALRGGRYVDYEAVWTLKRSVLEATFELFAERGDGPDRRDFESFARGGGEALRRHAAFEAFADEAGTVDRARWPAERRRPGDRLLERTARRHGRAMDFRVWLQWLAHRQLGDAAARSRAAGLVHGFYGDLAIGTAPDGGEIWADPSRFAGGVSLGAPPDPFAAAGQVWHLTPFRPGALAESGMDVYREILGANMRHAGALRIDHVLGVMRQFWVPDGAPGSFGAYVTFPDDALIATMAIESHRARCLIVGEDLGTVPEGLRARLAAAKLLSYKLLWFERDGPSFRSPRTYPHLSACCLSSHDLPTFMGWRRAAVPAEVDALRAAMAAEGIVPGSDDETMMAATHAMVASAPSALMLVQVDDLFGEAEPLNVPGTDRERPNWRRRLPEPVEKLKDRPAAGAVIAAVAKARPTSRS
jgi:glycogen operon protein